MPSSRRLSSSISAHCWRSSLGVQAAGHRHPLGMVGHGDVLQPAGLGGRGHLLDRGQPVGPSAVRCAGRRGCRPARPARAACPGGPTRIRAGPRAARAENRADPRRRRLPPRSARRSTLLAAKDAVLVDLQPAVLGQAAKHDVVRLRAGEVLQGRAERLGRHDAQVHLQSGCRGGPTFSCRRGRALRPRRVYAARRSIAAAASAATTRKSRSPIVSLPRR